MELSIIENKITPSLIYSIILSIIQQNRNKINYY